MTGASVGRYWISSTWVRIRSDDQDCVVGRAADHGDTALVGAPGVPCSFHVVCFACLGGELHVQPGAGVACVPSLVLLRFGASGVAE